MSIKANLDKIRQSLPKWVTLVAVSKTRSVNEIMEAYNAGQKIFGENKVQELREKVPALPNDIKWHMIGHLQRNKVKYIAPYIDLIHAVDSEELLREIDKRALQNDRIIDCLLQLHVAEESTKFGFDRDEIIDLLERGVLKELSNVRICGLMCMATFTDDEDQIKSEFSKLTSLFNEIQPEYMFDNPGFAIKSMGMSGDYEIAIESGSNMIRVGTTIFGQRNYT